MKTVNPECSRTIKFITLGCKVNQYDTQVIREQFLNAGFQELDDHPSADVYVINTCTVTASADSRSFNLIHRAIKENPLAKILVTGCLAELDEDKIKGINDKIVIVRNKEKENILNCLFSRKSPSTITLRCDFQWLGKCFMLSYTINNSRTVEQENQRTKLGISYFKEHTRAFLKIQDGCNNFCSYCKVPLVRGASRSRPLNEIIQEATKLVRNGFKELVLCGICLGSYGKDLQSQRNLVDVIEALEKIEGLLRIRLSSIEAGDVSEGLIEKMARSENLCRHLHIPMQSGDDEILKKMNRNYCREDYLNLIKKIKSNIPEIAITTDVLVGFPGEADSNFQNTVNLIKEILPSRTHIFPYSIREGTLAAKIFPERLSCKIVKERITYLKEIAQGCSIDFKKEFLNKTMDVLIEESVRYKRYWQGYTDNYIRVMVKSNANLKNHLIKVKLKRIVRDSVLADLC